MIINVVLFHNFETLDVFGPVEVFGKADGLEIKYYSLNGGLISNQDNIHIATEKLDQFISDQVLFLPAEGIKFQLH